MGIARELVELEAQLCKSRSLDPFSPIESAGLQSTPEAASLLERIQAARVAEPTAVLRLCLQALRIQHSEMSPRLLDAELVATLPPGMPGVARPTEQVVREMTAHATREIVLLGYEFTDEGILRLLASSASRGVEVIMICDRGRGSAERILEAWPSGTPHPRLFHDRERSDQAPHASMHAKCLLADGSDLLITSANFTFHGLHGNIEVGVRLHGSPAQEARKMFSHLVENRIVEELS